MGTDLRQKAKARLARERGSVAINRGAAVRVALAFPNVYGIAMASLGYQLVHQMLNSISGASSERVFLPDPNDLREHERTRTELFTLETQTPLSAYHAIAFSVSFELDYVNVLYMLRLANVPVRSDDRDERHPVVIAGGPCATLNPEPFADFVDAFVIGDAEETLAPLVAALESGLSKDREAALAALAVVPGVYVSRFYRPEYAPDGRVLRVEATPPAPERVRRAVARDLSSWPSSSAISTDEAEFGDIELVEVARGCGRKCRFCAAGHITRPPRARRVLTDGSARLGLVGAAVFDHPDAEEMCRQIVDSGGQFTVSSVRLETITPELASLMARGGQKTLTIAPEAATDRLRRVINKTATDDQVLSAVSAAVDAGIERVKLYFMIGLPTETDEDAEAIGDLCSRLAGEFPSIAFHASVSCFVPKPWTPFQWHPMEREDVLKRRMEVVRASVSRIRGVKLSGESPRLALVQALLARGDRRVGRAAESALDSGGNWNRALRDVDLDWYLHRPRDPDEALPWDHVDAGIRKDYLLDEYQRAMQEAVTPACRVTECRACGVCGEQQVIDETA